MKLLVTHETVYRYARPVTLQPHRLVVTPRGTHELTRLESRLETTPAAEIGWSQDVFGNLIATASFAEPADRLHIHSRVTVQQCAEPWPVFAIAPSAHSFPFDYSAAERTDLGALLVPDRPDEDVLRWVRAFAGAEPADTLTLLKAINHAIHAQIGYRARDEEGTQTPAETLTLRSGSCRDLATLLIAAARMLGFGARAVSGYLHVRSDDATAPDAQHGATHAWAEVYLPGAGWIAFDPTNDRMGNADLIPVAVARELGQIMPVSGGFVGTASDFLDMMVEVRVVPVQSRPET